MGDTSDGSLKDVIIREAIDHMFLTKKPPGKQSSNLEETEDFILNTFYKSVEEAVRETPFPQLDSVVQMLEKWTRIQPASYDFCHVTNLQQEISNIQTGCTLPIYVRNQNSTLMITRSSGDGNNLTVSTFRSSLPADMVMSAVCSQYLQLPETTENIRDIKLISSRVFAELVHELAVGGIHTLRKTRKGDQKYDETRDVADPRLVSDWIIGLLVPDTVLSEEGNLKKPDVTIRKKLRDQVSLQVVPGSSKHLPFRRSGMYTSLKVVLQLKLLERFSKLSEAKLVYKILMLRILTDSCHHFFTLCDKNIDSDLGSQMLVKLGVRVKKLERYALENPPSPQIELLKRNCFQLMESAVEQISRAMKGQWNKIAFPPSKCNKSRSRNAPTTQNYSEDTKHDIPELNECIAKLKTTVLRACANKQTIPDPFSRYQTLGDIIGINGYVDVPKSELLLKIWLQDVEHFIKYKCPENATPFQISRITMIYMANAKGAYKNNPLGISQMLLVALKAMEMVHRKVTRTYPLLRHYKTQVNCERLDHLVLPHRKDMELLDSLTDYFKTQDSRETFPIGILEREINGQSFSVRFAALNKGMEDYRETTLEKAEKDAEEKMAEASRTRIQCQQLQKQIFECGGKCTCQFLTKQRISRRGNLITFKELVLPKCENCQLVESHKSALQLKRYSVRIFEKPLPEATIEQQAVIFESAVPEDFVIWRDLLAYFKYELLGEEDLNGTKPNVTKWAKWVVVGSKKARTRNVCLGSTELPAKATYHTQLQNRDVLTYKNEQFVVNNCMNCFYNYKSRGDPLASCVKTACSFQLTSTSNSAPYSNLQVTLSSTEHSQNAIIAQQSSCSVKLSLREFVAFGSLRAGHRIQWRNLYESLHSEALSLEKEPVLALILQTIWQVGPRTKDEKLERESHLDIIQDNDFAEEFLDLLKRLVSNKSGNYSYPLVLLNAIMIARRILELNGSLERKCHDLMKEWRNVLSRWSKDASEQLNDMGTSTNEAMAASVKKLLMEISICSLFSFNVGDSTRLSAVIKEEQDIVHWMKSIYQFCQLSEKQNGLSEFFKILFHYAKTLPFRIGIGGISTAALLKAFKIFCKELWPKMEDCDIQSESVANNLITLKLLERTPTRNPHQITFSIFTGLFLVDGIKQSVLPPDITENELFQRYFKNVTNLRVQQDSNNVFTTLDTFRGRKYEIYSLVKGRVVIKEIKDTNTNLILLDPGSIRLHNYISNYFIHNHTHWLDIRENKVYFRTENALPDGMHHYELQLETTDETNAWKLYDVQNRQHYLSIRSTGFKRIISSLKSLEMAPYINVSINQQDVVTANLWRYNLRFTVKHDGCHESVEYSNFSICKSQFIFGTFIGLQQGLLLRNARKRIILVPHSTLQPKLDKHQHHITEISLAALRQPPLFVYEFDDVLKRLKAHNSKAAWIYLAALHATTSSSLPDPFTGMTGTEMAVNILQSARVWSCSPYDKESLATLKFLKSLSPKRTYYGFRGESEETMVSMESIKWPEAISSMAAYDGFDIIVDKLIADSERLAVLYGGESKSIEAVEVEDPTVPKLRLRAHFRHLRTYNPGVAVERKFFSESQLSLLPQQEVEKSIESQLESSSLNLKSLMDVSSSRLMHDNWPTLIKSGKFKKDSLSDFLYVNKPLESPLPKLTIEGKNTFLDLFHLDFRPNWLKLYRMACHCKTPEDENMFTIILASFAHRGVPVEQIVNLHVISSFAKSRRIHFPELPEGTPAISDITDHIFRRQVVEQFLERKCPTFPLKVPKRSRVDPGNIQYNLDLIAYNAQKERYAQEVKQRCSEIAGLIEMQWPCAQFVANELIVAQINYLRIDLANVICVINKFLHDLCRNYKLKGLLDSVQGKLNEIYDEQKDRDTDENEIQEQYNQLQRYVAKIHNECQKNDYGDWKLDDFIHNANESVETKLIFCTGKLLPTGDNAFSLPRQRRLHLAKIRQITNKILQMVTVNSAGKIIKFSGVMPRLCPISLLTRLEDDCQAEGEIIQSYVGALGVTLAQLKKINRCFAEQNETSEISGTGHENWIPQCHPEWLLLELELDIMIRPVQVDVAKQMMEMPGNGGNGVTQLNMGQGKTSVIVPMLCSKLAEKNKQLCRVTVLSSMFKMNLNSLTFSIGGLLNRRVYTFPCRRDTEIDKDVLQEMQNIYEECLSEQGVVLTLPEHRLSFRLLAYDKVLKSEADMGIEMLNVENWLRKYARDVLDESDELFSVKYQLVYTVGKQVTIDGGDLRWTACQEMLRIVQKVGAELWKAFGAASVEFDEKAFRDFPHQFATFRILNQSHMNQFINAVASILMKESNDIELSKREAIKEFMVNNPKSKMDHDKVIQDLNRHSPDKLNKILFLSGYLRRGVLELALTKRWRVEYGVNTKQDFRRMAVPFRAKDVAAEKTEFGHPDLAIILTHLSYYYSGLNDAQLEEVFEYLAAREEPAARYSSWISAIPDKHVGSNVPRQFYSLNMRDVRQKAAVFDLLRKHKSVIDYWLSTCVFPRESKQFPGKLVMTAWDLCYERQQHPVTGFSGTNDSQILLPLTISQQDLRELESTNETMERTLLQKENANHKGLRMGVTCREILEAMKNDNLKVLIDAGALMLELSNEGVADCWLEINPDIEAVVYFSQDDDLLVKCRDNPEGHHGTPFDVSPYNGQLEKCGVFLDDQHTRGTDLKFPVGSRACVTVGTRMKRDKLIQACMRMRKLGQGHTVSLYLSHEASDKVIKMEGKSYKGIITTDAVLKWVTSNTEQFNEDGLLYWALAGRNYAQRLLAEDNFHFPNYESPEITESDKENMSLLEEKANVLSSQCVDKEVLNLIDTYGQYTTEQLLTQIIPEWFNVAMQKLKEKCRDTPIDPKIVTRFNEICAQVLSRCRKYAGNKMVVTGMMEEEQERELELEKAVEVQEERVVVRPTKFESMEPSLHENVLDYVVKGGRLQVKDGIMPLSQVFKNTTCWKLIAGNNTGWKSVFVTKDFCFVILRTKANKDYFKTDSHLRPINYLVSWNAPPSGDLQLLVLSPHEVNELMPRFRNGQVKCKLHMFSLRRSEEQDLLLNNRRLQLPVKLHKQEMIPDASVGTLALLLASGNLYFVTRAELELFVAFICQASRAENQAVSLVKKILFCRHPVVSEVTHVMCLLSGKHVDLHLK